MLAAARRRLRETPFGASTREAALLLGRVLGLGEAQVLARSNDVLEDEAAQRFERLLERRLRGEPIAYVLGEREFYGRRFRVDPRVLIPRPETEHLIEAALEMNLPARPKILDVGTGSGCIAVTLALELEGATVVATDLSPGALAVALRNAADHGVAERVHPVATNLLEAVDSDRFDLVVSNPPYIDPSERSTLSPEITLYEPAQALFAPGRGDSILERLTQELGRTRPRAPVVLEIGFDQAARIAALAREHGLDVREIREDLAGRPRVAVLSS